MFANQSPFDRTAAEDNKDQLPSLMESCRACLNRQKSDGMIGKIRVSHASFQPTVQTSRSGCQIESARDSFMPSPAASVSKPSSNWLALKKTLPQPSHNKKPHKKAGFLTRHPNSKSNSAHHRHRSGSPSSSRLSQAPSETGAGPSSSRVNHALTGKRRHAANDVEALRGMVLDPEFEPGSKFVE